MINSLGQWGDRLLSKFVPSVAVAASTVYHYKFCETCVMPKFTNAKRQYRLTCTTGGYCYRSCTGPCWSYCQNSC